MPEIGPDKTTVVTYPPESLYESWNDHADDLDMSTSQFIIRMVEAGRKNVSMEEASSNSIQELLQQRAALKREVDRQRNRIQDLERQLERTSQSDIVAFVSDNPGACTAQIIQHVADTVPGRVAGQLDALEGDVLEAREDGYYPLQSDAQDASTIEEEAPEP